MHQHCRPDRREEHLLGVHPAVLPEEDSLVDREEAHRVVRLVVRLVVPEEDSHLGLVEDPIAKSCQYV